MRRTVSSLLVSSVLFTGAALFATSPAQADSATLPSDPAAHGYVGLCDEQGRNISAGSVDAAPFVWKAVASQAPPAQFGGTGQNAVLTIFQPRPQIPASGWSGTTLTSASFYTDKAHPTAQATYRDTSLKTITADFPAKVDGLYVLRMSFGKRNFGLYGATYPTTTIQVVGDRWRVISGGTVDCKAAKATSNEQLTGVAGARDTTPRTSSSARQRAVGGSGSAAATDTASGSATSAAGHQGDAPTSVAPKSGTGPYSQSPVALDASGNPIKDDGSSLVWLWLIVPALLLLAFGAVLWRRRVTH